MKTKTLIKTVLGMGALAGVLCFGFQPAKKIYEWAYVQLGNRYILDVANGEVYLKDLKTGQQEQIFDNLHLGNAEHRFSGLIKAIESDTARNEDLIERMQDYSCKRLSELNRNKPIAKDFENPYNLRILAKETSQGVESYLVNLATNDTLPIYKNNQVGDLKHRCQGMIDYLKQIMHFKK